MSGSTEKYKFGYFLGGEEYSDGIERQRWITADTNLGALSALLGNGVVTGWEATGTLGQTGASIALGYGFVYGLASETTESTDIAIPFVANQTYKILAQITQNTYYTKSVTFTTQDNAVATPTNAIVIATVQTDSSGYIGTAPDNTAKILIGTNNELLTALQNHVHSGTGSNPTKVNLETEVQGVLSADNLPTIPATKIIGGIPADKLKNISHTTLTDIGANTHLQIDDFINTINLTTFQHLGLVTAINVMQTFLVQSYMYGDEVFRYAANTQFIIPGISPATWYDSSTGPDRAEIDLVNYQVRGTHGIAVVPPINVTTAINKYEGVYGFSGPSQVDLENIDIYQVQDGANLTLKKLYSYDYYYDEGYLTVDYDAQASADWKTLTWTKDVFSNGATTGALGTMGLDLKVYAQSSIRQSNLPAYDAATGNWVSLGDYSVSSANLSTVPDNRWLRMLFKFSSNKDDLGIKAKLLTPVLQTLQLEFDRGADAQCSFIPVFQKEDWVTYQYSADAIDILEGIQGIVLSNSDHFSAGATYESPVIGSDDVIGWGNVLAAFTTVSGATTILSYRQSSSYFLPSDQTVTWTNLGAITDRTDLVSLTGKYIQLRITITRTATTASSPELLAIGVTAFEEEKGSRNLIIKSWVKDGTTFRGTLGLYTTHNMVPGSNIHISGGVDTPALSLNGTFKLLEGSYGLTLAFNAMTGPAVAFVSPPTTTGPIVNPVQTLCKTWNRKGTVAGGYSEIVAGGQSFEVATVPSGLTTTIDGSMQLASNSPAEWVSTPFSSKDTDFLAWDSIEIHGEGLMGVTVTVEYSDTPGSNVWFTEATTYTTSTGKSPLKVDLSNMVNKTRAWIRVKVRLAKV